MHRYSFTVRALAALLLSAALLPLPAGAATVRRLELDEIRSRAEAVFTGEVVGISARMGLDGKMVWTDYEIEVSESIAGRDPGRFARVSFAGGTLPELSIGIPGMPELRIGDHYVFFLEPRPDPNSPAVMPTVGWGQGLYRIVRVDDGDRSRTALVSTDGEPLEISQAGLLTRGSLVYVREGHIIEPAAATRAAGGVRMRPTYAESPDGTITRLTPAPAPQVSTVRPTRTFATIDDLRLFVHGRLGAVSARNE